MIEPPALPVHPPPRQLPSLAAEASGSLAGNPSQMQHHPPSLHNCRADAAREAAAQTQVVPPATSSLILDRPTITFGPETICWAKGEEGLEGKEEEREGRGVVRG